MLDALKRLFSGSAGAAPEPTPWDAVAAWAQSREYALRGVHDGEGFVVDGRMGATAWRLEWGPSQRPYIEGQELRIRAELGLAAELQAVVMNRELQEVMEKAVFEQYVEGVQTRIDNQTPPEMRWLVMYAALDAAQMPAGLHERFVAVGSNAEWLAKWLEGPLSQALAASRERHEAPLVLMIGRGRLMLRTALADPDLQPLQAWLRVFETAIRESGK